MILTTKRLVLREIEEQDWRAVLAYLSHPLYLRYNPWTHRTELEKIGMRQEGRLRENEWMKGRWWDTLLYAILEQEWKTRPRTPMCEANHKPSMPSSIVSHGKSMHTPL